MSPNLFLIPKLDNMNKHILAITIGILTTVACKQKVETSNSTATSTINTSTAAVDTPSTPTSPVPQVDNKNIITEGTFAGIGHNTTLDDIKKMFSGSNITEGKEAAAPESEETVTVTYINKGKPDEIVIRWMEGKKHKSPSIVTTRQKGSPYKTTEGIQIGTSLAKLAEINKDIIEFSGLGWGFGGFISNYGKAGALGPASSGKYSIRLSSSTDKFASDFPLGDKTFKTTDAVVKKHAATIVVGELEVNFY